MCSPQRNKIVHNYHDYSRVSELENELAKILEQPSKPSVIAGTVAMAAADGGNRAELNFPVRLHYMLTELDKDGLSDIVSWQPHGRCFRVHKQKRFVREILPLWFRQSRYQSFQRQLNIYGFKRLTTGRDKGSYYHEFFLRGKRFLCQRIQRVKVKGTKTRQASSPETEPNFYTAPYLPLDDGTSGSNRNSLQGDYSTSGDGQQSEDGSEILTTNTAAKAAAVVAAAAAAARQQDALSSIVRQGLPFEAASTASPTLSSLLQQQRLQRIQQERNKLSELLGGGVGTAGLVGTSAVGSTAASLLQRQQLLTSSFPSTSTFPIRDTTSSLLRLYNSDVVFQELYQQRLQNLLQLQNQHQASSSNDDALLLEALQRQEQQLRLQQSQLLSYPF